MRVGLAYGPVLERESDLYGPTVNLASRIMGIAFPGTVVVNEALRKELADDQRYRLRSMRPRYLKDIGAHAPVGARAAALTPPAP